MRSELLVAGKARATTYALHRTIDGVRSPIPLYEVDVDGAIVHRANLHPVDPFGHWVEPLDDAIDGGFYEADPDDFSPTGHFDLPWFLRDLRPDGYLGRAWLRAHPDEGYPHVLSTWSGDHVLRFATMHGADLPGAWMLGAAMRNRVAHDEVVRGEEVPAPELDAVLPALADRVVASGPRGSSPGGEQPKLAVRTRSDDEVVSWIVKFTAPLRTEAGRRWGDLLVAEHLAHVVLEQQGIASCESRIVDSGGRRFLQVRRFDRHGARGRSGLVSLLQLDREGVASDLRRWGLVTEELVRQRRLSKADHETTLWLEAFGQAIANTDMHLGNLSVLLDGTTITGLAPVYDMLPMAYRPTAGGEVVPGMREVTVPRGAPPSALEAARELWRRVSVDERVSEEFRAIARTHAEA